VFRGLFVLFRQTCKHFFIESGTTQWSRDPKQLRRIAKIAIICNCHHWKPGQADVELKICVNKQKFKAPRGTRKAAEIRSLLAFSSY